MKDNKFYITTAIPYMNAKLHLGQVYEFIITDVMARFHRLMGRDVYFLTGSDEHGQKIYKSAESKGVTPQQYVDGMVEDMKRILKLYNISNDGFIRTTDKKHEEVVKNIFNTLKDNGDIYKDHYEGWYCVPCETFLTDGQLVDGKCPDCGRDVEKVKEENYFFKLSKYEEKLIKYIEDNPDFIVPETRKNEVMGILKQGLKDISVSRTTVKWGVPLPFDEKHFSYVWVDALVNYISALGFSLDDSKLFDSLWPADQHHIGKDILKFHAIIWPAMLMSLGIGLPEHLLVHGWLMLGEEKLSKSKGITLDPDELSEEFGIDGIRYFLTREISFGLDGSFTKQSMIKRYNGDLSNDIGNLASRTMAMVKKYRDGIIPEANSDGNLLQKEWDSAKSGAISLLENYKYSEYISRIWEYINLTNKYIEDSQPWTVAKSDEAEDIKKLDGILYDLMEAIRLSCMLLIPVMPSTCQKIFDMLGTGDNIDDALLEKNAVWGSFKGEAKMGEREILFPRIEEDKNE